MGRTRQQTAVTLTQNSGRHAIHVQCIALSSFCSPLITAHTQAKTRTHTQNTKQTATKTTQNDEGPGGTIYPTKQKN